MKRPLSITFGALLIATPAAAVEGGLDPYARGFAGFMSGAVPPDPGLYLTDIFYAYDGSAGAEVRGGNVELNVEANLQLDMVEGVYVTPWHILGATYAFGGAVGYGWAGLDAAVQTQLGSRTVSLNAANISDSLLTPIILGWNSGDFHWNLGMNIYVPTGPYDKNKLSLGKNVWGFMPQFALTYFDPKSGLDVSGTLVYVTTTNNDATAYQSGDVLHFDWALGEHFGAHGEWEAGLVGNLVQQVSADRGAGAKLGPFEEQSYGIGIGGSYSTVLGTMPANFGVRWEHDIDAENTFKGDVVVATATLKF
jgi:hypothetical protein